MAIQAHSHSLGTPLRCSRTLLSHPCPAGNGNSCVPVLQSPWGLRDAPREEQSPNQHFPFPRGSGALTAALGCAALLAQPWFLLCSLCSPSREKTTVSPAWDPLDPAMAALWDPAKSLFGGTGMLWPGSKSCSWGGREEIPQLKQKINFGAVW